MSHSLPTYNSLHLVENNYDYNIFHAETGFLFIVVQKKVPKNKHKQSCHSFVPLNATSKDLNHPVQTQSSQSLVCYIPYLP